MPTTTKEFCQFLVEQVPEIRTILRNHLDDFSEMLPHVFLGELTRYVLANGASKIRIVELLEENFDRHGPEIENLISVSFVENLETEIDLENATTGISSVNLVNEWRRQKT
jgi:hypothetical protein